MVPNPNKPEETWLYQTAHRYAVAHDLIVDYVDYKEGTVSLSKVLPFNLLMDWEEAQPPKICEVPVKALVAFSELLECSSWNCPLVSPDDVQRALDRNDLLDRPVNSETEDIDTRAHAARIAYLVRSGWSDPIQLDIDRPDPSGNYKPHPIVDGNHRLYAAYIRGDETIACEISGDLDYTEQLFGIPLCEKP